MRCDGLHRRINAALWNRLVATTFRLPVRDVDCAFKLIRRELLVDAGLSCAEATISTEIPVKTLRRGLGSRRSASVTGRASPGAPAARPHGSCSAPSSSSRGYAGRSARCPGVIVRGDRSARAAAAPRAILPLQQLAGKRRAAARPPAARLAPGRRARDRCSRNVAPSTVGACPGGQRDRGGRAPGRGRDLRLWAAWSSCSGSCSGATGRGRMPRTTTSTGASPRRKTPRGSPPAISSRCRFGPPHSGSSGASTCTCRREPRSVPRPVAATA